MNDAGTLPRHLLDIRELTPEAFAPYGEVIAPLHTGGQGSATPHGPETGPGEASLVLTNGEPRLWIMHLPHVGLGFSRIARHRRVTRARGSRTSSPFACPATASSSCTSPPGTPGRISSTTNACS
jgi:hypothetical protein